ncbi:MAG: GspH/FimT family pseudopilin [Burkholderiaceae bacterium]|nr:GspH/FimT family pseudopilin [Burkholderiaceae bacterium]
MLNISHRHPAAGFTLIEMLIAVVLLGILAIAAGPSFHTFMVNTRIRNVAESLQNGLRLAQIEATKRNAQVDFVMTTASQFTSNPTNGAPTASASGTAWVVREPASTFIAGKVTAEGSDSVSVTASVPAGCAAFDGNINFDGLGRTLLPCNLTLAVDDSTSSDSSKRPLSVLVSPGGKIRMCNPLFAAGDPQACS